MNTLPRDQVRDISSWKYVCMSPRLKNDLMVQNQNTYTIPSLSPPPHTHPLRVTLANHNIAPTSGEGRAFQNPNAAPTWLIPAWTAEPWRLYYHLLWFNLEICSLSPATALVLYSSLSWVISVHTSLPRIKSFAGFKLLNTVIASNDTKTDRGWGEGNKIIFNIRFLFKPWGFTFPLIMF